MVLDRVVNNMEKFSKFTVFDFETCGLQHPIFAVSLGFIYYENFKKVHSDYILINPEGFVSIIPIVVGIMLVIESFDKISTTLSARKNGYQDWLKMLIPSVIIFILGLILILNPFESVTVFIRVIGIFLIIDAISNVYLAYNYGKI